MVKVGAEHIRTPPPIPYSVRVTGIQLTSHVRGNLSGRITVAIESPDGNASLNRDFVGASSLEGAMKAALQSVQDWAEKVAAAASQAL